MRKVADGSWWGLLLAGLVACAAPLASPASAPPTSGASPNPVAAGAAAPPTAASAPAVVPAPVKLNQVEPGSTVGLVVVRAGAEKGFFAEEGLEIEFTAVPRGDTRLAALLSGDAQIGLGTAEDVIRARDQGLSLPIIASVLNAITYNIVAQPQYHTIGDLRGGTIGVVDLTSGSSTVLFEIMRANGLELNRDYQALITGGASDRVTSLRAGVISATTLPVPDSTRVIEEGYTNLGDAADYIKEYQNSPISVRAEWGSQNRATVVRYLRGLLRTMDWLYTQKDEFVPIAARLLSLEPRYAGVGWDTYTGKAVWPRDGRPTMNGLLKVIDILAQQGTFGSNPSPKPEEFVDLSYIDEAQRTLSSSAR